MRSKAFHLLVGDSFLLFPRESNRSFKISRISLVLLFITITFCGKKGPFDGLVYFHKSVKSLKRIAIQQASYACITNDPLDVPSTIEYFSYTSLQVQGEIRLLWSIGWHSFPLSSAVVMKPTLKAAIPCKVSIIIFISLQMSGLQFQPRTVEWELKKIEDTHFSAHKISFRQSQSQIDSSQQR